MEFSRRYIEILNATKDGGTDVALSRVRSIVENWVTNEILEATDARWLNRRIVPHRTVLRPSLAPGRPETETEMDAKAQDLAKIAASSFADFLSEVAESKASGPGRLGVRTCSVCGEFFVQEEVGRDRLVCSNRCKFRLRRSAEKKTAKKKTTRRRGAKSD